MNIGSSNSSLFAGTIGVHRPSFSGFSGRMTMRFKDGETGQAGGQQSAQGSQGGQQSGQQGAAQGQQSQVGQQQGGAITFATQDELDEFLEKRIGRTRRTYDKQIDDLTKEVEKLKGKGGKDAQQGAQGQQAQGNERTYTQAELQELIAKRDEEYTPKLKAAEDRVSKLLEKERSAAIISAAARANAIDPEDVSLLVGRHVSHDEDGALVVLNEKGTPRLNSKGEPLSVEEFVKAFVESKPHLKRGSGTSGAGSGTSNNGTTSAQTFTKDQLNDPAFYKANREAIHRAAREGRLTS